MSNHLENKVIAITGAANGFGRLIAEKCAAGGAAVVAIDIDPSAVTSVVEEIEAAGGRAIAVVADVADIDQLRRAVAVAVDAFGALDVMVNNAGVMPLGYFSEHDRAIERWHRAIDINLKGVLNGMCASYDQMIAQGRGQIVNISSVYANGGIEGSGVYSATKAAVAVLSDSFRVEAQGRIKVSTVKPTGVFGTRLHRSMVNRDAVMGLVGQHADSYSQRVSAYIEKRLPAELADRDAVTYWLITPDDLANAVVHVIDQPWGISYSDVTVRAAGEDYVF